MKSVLITIVVLLAILAGGYGAFRLALVLRDDGGASVRTQTAQLRDLRQQVATTGEVRPVVESIVKSEISGRIEKLLIEEGTAVSRGEPLVLLDTVFLETRLREVERSLESDRLRYDRAKRNLDRARQLHEKNFVGEQDFLDATTDYGLAELSIEIVQTRVEDAREDLSRSRIVAPHNGVITLLRVTEGQVIAGLTSVTNGTDLMNIADLSRLYMEANVNEVDVSKIAKGDSVEVTFDAYPELDITGKIDFIAPTARREGNTRVFPVHILLDQVDERIRPGISATVAVTIGFAEQVVAIPLAAVFSDDEGRFVFVEREGSYRRRSVTLGISDLRYVEILSGLNAGESVALQRPPQNRLL